MSFRIMLSGGGSGGHVYPLVAVAEKLKELSPSYHKSVKMLFIGEGKLLRQSADELGIGFRGVLAPKWRRYKSWKNFIDILKIPIALFQSILYVWLFMPDVMLIKGGYASFFPALAARLLFVPLVVHESDSVPGKTNLYWGRHSRKVFISFEHARQYFNPNRVELVGNPIRPELLIPIEKSKAMAEFNLPAEKPVVFITGGSLGAQSINDAVELAMPELQQEFSVIHLKDGSFNVQKMALAYSAADIVVSRAGSAIFEIASLGKPVVLIPLEGAAQDHQTINADEFSKHGAIVLAQNNLLPHILIHQIKRAYEEREERSAQIKAFARPDAADKIAKELLGAATI